MTHHRAALVGMEGSSYVLFRIMSVFGFILAKRRPSGGYKVSWARVFPMAIITSSMLYFLFTFSMVYTNTAYDRLVDLIPYTICIVHVVFTFMVAIYKRQESCSLLQGLDESLKPPPPFVSVLFCTLYILNFFAFVCINFIHTDGKGMTVLYSMATALVYPTTPLLVDQLVVNMMRALNQVTRKAVERVVSVAKTREPKKITNSSLGIISVSENKSDRLAKDTSVNVAAILAEWQSVSHLVNLHNEVFSTWALVRCGALMAKLLDATYYLTIFYGSWLKFTASFWYIINEITSFYLLCHQADAIVEKHKKFEDGVHNLLQHPTTPFEERFHLLGLLHHLRSRPAQICIGNVGNLGSHVLIIMLNVTVTLSAIVYQYRPRADV